MVLLYGRDEAKERMQKETMEPEHMVEIDHDFYTNNHKAKKRKDKEVHDAIFKPTGDEIGYKGREIRDKFAMGGVVKERRGFYGKYK